MKKNTFCLVVFICFTSLIKLNAQVFEVVITNQSEAEAFITSPPSGFGTTGTVSSGQWGGTYGIRINGNSALTYTATNLAAGSYTMEAVIMIQNVGHTWIQDGWASGGTVPTPVVQSGTAGSYVTYTKSVTVASAGDYTFGIVRGNHGSQMYVSNWTVTKDTGSSSATDITSFELAEEAGPATIDTNNHTVSISVLNGTNLSSLAPTIEVSQGATISPLSGIAQDFSAGSVDYTVTAEDTTTIQVWTVTVTEAAPASPLFDFSVGDQTETEAFVNSLPSGYDSTGTIEAKSWGGTWGVKLLANSSLTFSSLGLPAGNYTLEANLMVQNPSVLPWEQGFWATSGGTAPTPSTQSGTPNTFVTYTTNITIPSTGNYTFGIVRGGTGAQLYVQSWKITEATLDVQGNTIENNLKISKTAVALQNTSGHIQIIDLLGRTLASTKLNRNEVFNYTFDTAKVYMIHATTSSSSITKKVVFRE